MSDAVAETQKRIAALRHDTPPRTGSNDSSKLDKAAAAPEARGPKKLSDVRVNPSIAAAFGAGESTVSKSGLSSVSKLAAHEV